MAENQLAVQSNPQLVAIQNALAGESKAIRASLGDDAGAFNASLMDLIKSDAKLLMCNPGLLMAEAVKAASLKLPINKQLGFAYLIPYGTTPTLVIGFRGYLQMAMRTGQYRNINADLVYEGELEHKDKLTGAISLNGEKKSETVIGYFAHFETINGFTKTLYMSLEEMANYCLTYSPSYKNSRQKPTAQALMDQAQKQAQNGPDNGVGWWANFNAMAIKTVLRRLLSKYGYLSIEMQKAISSDDMPSAESVRDKENLEARPVVNVSQAFVNAEEVKEEQAPEPEDKPDF